MKYRVAFLRAANPQIAVVDVLRYMVGDPMKQLLVLARLAKLPELQQFHVVLYVQPQLGKPAAVLGAIENRLQVYHKGLENLVFEDIVLTLPN